MIKMIVIDINGVDGYLHIVISVHNKKEDVKTKISI